MPAAPRWSSPLLLSRRVASHERRAGAIVGHYGLDPFHGPLLLFYLGVAHFMLEDYTQALAIMRDFVAQASVRPWGHAMRAMILTQLSQVEKAQAETAEALRLDSTFTVSGTAKSLAAFKHAKDHEHFFSAFRQAGFPD